MTAAELKARLPLPEIMARCGDGEHAKKSAKCPFHEDGRNSFSVFQRDGLWFWKCHAGCGEGDELDYLKRKFALGDSDAFQKWRELAGLNGTGNKNTEQSRPASPPAGKERAAITVTPADKEAPDQSETWRKCVAAFTGNHAGKLATWRGYSPEFVGWLREHELIGLHEGKLALPVHNGAGAVVAFHVRERDGSWRFHPCGCRVRPLLIGEPKVADVVFTFESQWDAFAVLDKLAWHKSALSGVAVIVTRGASNGKLVRGLAERGAVLYAFRQNDREDPERKCLKWLADVTEAAVADGATVKHVATPPEHKDPNDWTRTGATANDLYAAMEAATEVKPSKSEQEQAALQAFESALVTSGELHGLFVPERRFIVRPFLKEGDLGFIYAKRGDGKTWLAMVLAIAAATGGKAGPWEAEGCCPVLYVDGEMPADESKRRDKLLGGAGDKLIWLHHEIYFERTGRTLNLTDPQTQAALTEIVLRHGVRLLWLDNLSCLFYGMKENDADGWELVLPWLLDLRRRKIAVVIVAHAGRSGQNIRGTSRREDQAFWVLKLERKDNDSVDAVEHSLRFTSLFTKNRNALEEACPPLDWTITADSDGAATVTATPISGVELLVSWVRAGLESASDIAAEMGISKGQVSKLAKKAERLGEIVIEGRCYRATENKK